MNDEQYLLHCRTLLAEFSRTFVTRTAVLPADHPLRELALGFAELDEQTAADLYTLGPELVSRLFDTILILHQRFRGSTVWFLGGDCLHYMADEEILQYQQLEDLRVKAASSGTAFNFNDARAKLLNLQ
ncbi:MAG: hypothetical protein IPG06_01290 [Haliea sp.]|nr:hypothetical protein [Haliea sp.]